MASMVRVWIGISIIMISFFVGLFMMISGLESGNMSVGLILFYVLGIPLIGMIIGVPIMISSGIGPESRRLLLASRHSTTSTSPSESFVHEPPTFCTNCGGKISNQNVDWVGPLTIKCPYCGSTLQTVRRRV